MLLQYMLHQIVESWLIVIAIALHNYKFSYLYTTILV